MFSFIQLITFFFLSNQVMDTRELRYVFTKPVDFESDIKMMAIRYKELKDTDNLDLVYLFPPRNIINEYLIFNRAYKVYLTQTRDLYPNSTSIQQALEETDHLYKIWDLCRDCQTEYYYIHVRRQALKGLKSRLDEIDPTWYDKGILPHFVPIWRFGEIR